MNILGGASANNLGVFLYPQGYNGTLRHISTRPNLRVSGAGSFPSCSCVQKLMLASYVQNNATADLSNLLKELPYAKELKTYLLDRMAGTDQDKLETIIENFKKHGFISPLELLQNIAEENLGEAPAEFKAELNVIYQAVSGKHHNLSGWSAKDTSKATMALADLYIRLLPSMGANPAMNTSGSEVFEHVTDLKVVAGDFTNLANTNNIFAKRVDDFLTTLLDIDKTDNKYKVNLSPDKVESVKDTLAKTLGSLVLERDLAVLEKIMAGETDKNGNNYSDPQLIHKELLNISSLAGKRLTDRAGFTLCSIADRIFSETSESSVYSFGMGGDEVGAIAVDKKTDEEWQLSVNQIHHIYGSYAKAMALDRHPHSKYPSMINNGFNLLFEVQSLLSRQFQEEDSDKTIGTYNALDPKIGYSKSIVGALSKGTVDPSRIEPEGDLLPQEFIETVNKIISELNNEYSKNGAAYNAFISGDERFSLDSLRSFVDDELIKSSEEPKTPFVKDLAERFEILKEEIIKSNDFSEESSLDEQFQYLDLIVCRLIVRENLSIKYLLSLENESTYNGVEDIWSKSDYENSLANNFISKEQAGSLDVADYVQYFESINSVYDKAKGLQLKETSQDLFADLEFKALPGLLFTDIAKKRQAKFQLWKNHMEAQGMNISPAQEEEFMKAIDLLNKRDPNTNTNHGDMLSATLRSFREDIDLAEEILQGLTKQDLEPLLIAFTFTNLAGINKSVGPDAGDKILNIIAQDMKSVLIEQGFPEESVDSMIFHRGGAKFVIILPPLINLDEDLTLLSKQDLSEKAEQMQKALIDTISKINRNSVDDYVESKMGDKNKRIAEIIHPKNPAIAGMQCVYTRASFLNSSSESHEVGNYLAALYRDMELLEEIYKISAQEGAEFNEEYINNFNLFDINYYGQL